MKTMYIAGSLTALSLAAAAAASPWGSDLPTIGANALQAYSIETGELVFSGSSSLGGPAGVVSYNSGIDMFPSDPSSPNHGPFIVALTDTAIIDDYSNDPSVTGTNELTQFQFVGGVASANDTVEFFFLDDNMDVVDGFSVTLPQGGNFIWTVNLEGLGFMAADSGFVQFQHEGAGEVTWFGTDTVHVGSNLWDGSNDGSADGTIYSFSMMVIPAPSALALLGLAGLVGSNRRRRA